jgi:hypothetical protein
MATELSGASGANARLQKASVAVKRDNRKGNATQSTAHYTRQQTSAHNA